MKDAIGLVEGQFEQRGLRQLDSVKAIILYGAQVWTLIRVSASATWISLSISE
jgi:hypothetical protein